MILQITAIAGALVVPVLMALSGLLVWKFPAKNINVAYGYRTKRSMKNMDTWMFAQEYTGRLWVKLGCGLLALTLVVCFCVRGYSDDNVATTCVIMVGAQIAVMVLLTFITEHALKLNFDEEGKRRQCE